jgi:hypothetical protein
MQKPGKFQAIALMQLITGIIYVASMALAILASCGTVLIAVTPLYGMAVGVFAIISGVKGMGDDCKSWKHYRLVAILQIVSIIAGDVLSLVSGILTLIFLNEPEVAAFLSGDCNCGCGCAVDTPEEAEVVEATEEPEAEETEEKEG